MDILLAIEIPKFQKEFKILFALEIKGGELQEVPPPPFSMCQDP